MTDSSDIYTAGTGAGVTPEIQALRLASGHVTAQAVYVFTALGIPDLLRAGPMTSQAIADATDCDASVLYRVLRFLASVDVVSATDAGEFSLTKVGRALCRKPLPVIADNVLLTAAPSYWTALGGLLDNVRTGETAFDRVLGTSFFEYLDEHPDENKVFNAAMDSSSTLGIGAVVSAYDFAAFSSIVDVAGGKGALLTGILKKHPALTGTLYDAPRVLDQHTVDPSVAERLKKVPGNFFESVPPGADAYILRRILHDWNDAKSLAILEQIRKACAVGKKLLIVELAAPAPGETGNNWAALDLLMMLLMDGRERTREDFEMLLDAAGFELTRIVPTNSPYWIVEATAA